MSDAFDQRRRVDRHFVGRVSSNESDPGYSDWCNLMLNYTLDIRCDGVPQPHCDTANVEEGWIDRLKMVMGEPVIVDDNWVTERIRGVVEVKMIKRKR